MLTVSVVLYLVAAAGVGALSIKYLAGPTPTPYHAEILEKAGVPLAPALRRLLGGLYHVIGSALLAFGLLVAALAVFGVGQGAFWANAVLLISVLIVGGLSTRAAWGLEQATGVRTPWRPAAALTVMGVVAFILAAA